jgi:hypothetical protein
MTSPIRSVDDLIKEEEEKLLRDVENYIKSLRDKNPSMSADNLRRIAEELLRKNREMIHKKYI